MGIGVTDLKREAMLREWSARIAECRGSGKAVKEWCAEQGISAQTYYRWEKRFVEKASQQLILQAPTQSGMLVRVNPDALPGGDEAGAGSGITIRHGESVITLPSGSSAEAVADLVKALNRHA